MKVVLYCLGASSEHLITVEDNVTSWLPGDRIVIASTDYDMEQAEEFTVLQCDDCDDNQVLIEGTVTW